MSAATEHNWFNVTTWADRDWKQCLEGYWRDMAKWHGYPEQEARLRKNIEWARKDYREQILSWYFKLCSPMRIGECTPTSVAELLAEAWDLGEWRWWTNSAGSAVRTNP